MGLKDFAERKAVDAFVKHELTKLEKDPQGTFINLMGYAKKMNVFEDETFNKAIRVAEDDNNGWTKYGIDIAKNIDRNILYKTLMNFGYEASLYGSKIREKYREEWGTNLPWTILFDPTSACNLHCIGCWAAEYGDKLNLSFEEMDSIVQQGKDMGIYFYLVTGGEPLVRKDDLIKLADKHNDCCFHIFTNGTLIDEEFCKEVREAGNISFALSIEGTEESTDLRRGDGVFQKVMKAMDLMKEHKLLYGASICYTSQNYKYVTDDDFIKMLVDHGCKLAWFFHYMPVGKDADVSLLLSPEEREHVYHKVREIRSAEYPQNIFTIDFQNDGEFINGCIAGGKNYFHINSLGDMEPCVFIHYSDSNIREKTIKECLMSPLFMGFHDNQPFNKNLLKPCPMLENPGRLTKIVNDSGARNTDMIAPESAEELQVKTTPYAMAWNKKANELWDESRKKREEA